MKRKSILRFVNEELAAPADVELDDNADQQTPIKRSRIANRPEDQEPAEMTRLLDQQLICNFQSDAIWFLTRSFRMTSSITAEVLNYLFKVKSDLGQDLENVDDEIIGLLRIMLSFPACNPDVPVLPDLSNLESTPRSCTLEDIKEAARDRHISGFSSISWQDRDHDALMRVVRALQEYRPDDNNLDSVINKLLLRKWFLSKQTKTKSMDAGTRNEPYVVEGVMNFLNNNNTACALLSDLILSSPG